MNGRTLAGVVLMVAGLALAAFGAYRVMTGDSESPAAVVVTPTSSPDPAASLVASATPAPTPTATLAPTATPAPTPVPNPTVPPADVAAIRAFLVNLVDAIRSGEVERLSAAVNGATIDRYGVAACEAKLATDAADPTYAVEVHAIHPLAPWDYTTDGRTTRIEEAWTIDATVTAQGRMQRRELHVAPKDGAVSWFTDCGTPLPAP